MSRVELRRRVAVSQVLEPGAWLLHSEKEQPWVKYWELGQAQPEQERRC